ncbi:MAG: Tm-1-like ATP-binding domain-containing protein [Spirochaetota bacterium]|nr:MAG: Tm-1-like ATP-binding domain-containing protein [Spirochaetota bacterium]
MNKTIVLIATLDTKGIETSYIREGLIACGKRVIGVDSGILGEAQKIEPDIGRDKVAKYGGCKLDDIRTSQSLGEAVQKVPECVKVFLNLLDLTARFDM